jgi:hypothetical protein
VVVVPFSHCVNCVNFCGAKGSSFEMAQGFLGMTVAQNYRRSWVKTYRSSIELNHPILNRFEAVLLLYCGRTSQVR